MQSISPKCLLCKSEFTPTRKNQKWCSRVCANRATGLKLNTLPKTKTCEYCQGEFKPRWSGSRFCTRSCSALFACNTRDSGRRVCKTCGQTFQANGQNQRFCSKECGKPNHKKSVRRWFVKKRYGLSPEDVKRMEEEQSGCCAICGCPASESTWSRLVVDHCHKTGRVRGLVCDACNKGMGILGDDPERLRAAADYLERYVEDTTNGEFTD